MDSKSCKRGLRASPNGHQKVKKNLEHENTDHFMIDFNQISGAFTLVQTRLQRVVVKYMSVDAGRLDGLCQSSAVICVHKTVNC